MNKAAACIKLIQVLSVRSDYVSTEELADILETNPRNIREYIKELEVAGYTLESMKGVYGGYRLDKSCLLPSLKLNQDDKKVIASLMDYLVQKNDFLSFTQLETVLGRMMASVERTDEITPLTMIDRFPLQMDKYCCNNCRRWEKPQFSAKDFKLIQMDIHHLVVRQQQANGATCSKEDQRGNHRLDPHLRNQEPVEQAAQACDGNTGDHADKNGHLQVFKSAHMGYAEAGQQHTAQAACQAHDRSD